MEMNGSIRVIGNLSALVIRADGSHLDCGVIAADDKRSGFWKQVWSTLKREGKIPAAMGFAAFLAHFVSPEAAAMALVTTAGANYMASDFASGGSSPTISGFKYHDCGTGTTAAATGDTALGTAFGGSRVSGTATNPSANVYQSVATISFSGTFAVTEWGLFSASTSGTLWDRRVFSAINVGSGDSIQFTYQLTVPAGGS